jgi:hypothetical protein
METGRGMMVVRGRMGACVSYRSTRPCEREYPGSGRPGQFGTGDAAGRHDADPRSAELVTGNYFDMLGIKAAIGRPLQPDDSPAPVGNPVAVLSHGFWQREFGGDPSVLNRTIRVNNYPLTVVGVAALGFSGTVTGAKPRLVPPADDGQSGRTSAGSTSSRRS